MTWLQPVLQLLEPLVALLVSILIVYIGKKMRFEGVKKDALEDVGTSVTSIYHEFVKDRKDANEDGKLTKEEKKEARNRLWKNVIKTAKGPALKLLTTWGQEKVQTYAEQFITKLKGKK